MPNKAHHEINRRSWNEACKAHNSHKGDQAAFFRAGGNTLFPEEQSLLGALRGQSLLHLQCNCGQDSLSIARHLGAQVTGLDISDEAVRFARQLARESGISSEFIRADIYDFFASNQRHFDTVFASYGVLCWLSDLQEWARGIARCLRAGGRFVLLEFHPAFAMFDEGWRLRYDYMGGGYIEFEHGVGDYVALTGSTAEIECILPGTRDFVNPYPGVEYQWGLAELISALLAAGLQLSHFAEYGYCNGFCPIPSMRDLGGRRYGAAPDMPQQIPLMFSLVAEQPA